jgi:hypothetical protein
MREREESPWPDTEERRFAPPGRPDDRKFSQYVAQLQRARDAFRERRETRLKLLESERFGSRR